MKKLIATLLILIAVLCLSTAGAEGGTEPEPDPAPVQEERPNVILYSVLKEKAEDGTIRVSFCCIDASGGLWNAEKTEAETNEEILRAMAERRGMEAKGSIIGRRYDGKYVDANRMKELAIMADTVASSIEMPEKTGAGIGENAVYALKYDLDDNPEPVLLGMSGDAVFENRDPGAQALYQFMLYFQCFYPPCGFAEEGLTPHGFTMITVREFFGLENVNAETAVISGAMSDCEEGFIDIQLTDEDRRKAIALLERGVVIGKHDPWMVTGGTINYFFYDENGEFVGVIETYEEDSLAVGPDGMYTLSLLPESTKDLTEEEKQLVRLKINGTEYELGRSTPRDLIRNGWYCYIETDGSFAFTDDEGIGTYYINTRGGSVDEPITTINCQFAYEIPFEYCGFDGTVDPYNTEDMDTVWYLRELEELKARYPDETFRELDDLKEIDPDDEDEGGENWGPMEFWMKTLGEEEPDLDNGTGVNVTLSDGHLLWLFSAKSPVSLSLGHKDYIRLGPESEEDEW